MRKQTIAYLLLLCATSISYLYLFFSISPKTVDSSIEVVAPIETQRIFSAVHAELDQQMNSDLIFSYLPNSSLLSSSLRYNSERLIRIFPDVLTLNQFRSRGNPKVQSCVPAFRGQIGLFDTRVVSSSSDNSTTLEEIFNRISEGFPQHDALVAPDPNIADSGYSFLTALLSLGDIEKISTFLKIVSHYDTSERHMLGQVLEDDRLSAITTLDAIKGYGFEQRGIFRPLNPPQELSYQVCFLGKNWTKEHISSFMSYFEKPSFHARLENFGFLPTEPAIKNALEEEIGSSPDAPRAIDLLSQWDHIRKPHHTILMLDASASLEGKLLENIKAGLKSALLNDKSTNEFSLVTFQSRIDVLIRSTGDKAKIINAIEQLDASGGSAVYDGIKGGLDIANHSNPFDEEIKLILITDGDDTNSTSTHSEVLKELTASKNSKLISFSVIAIDSGPYSEFSKLLDLSQATGAFLIETSPDRLKSVIGQVLLN